MSKKDGEEIPQEVISALARLLLPEIQKLYDTDEGKQLLAKWENEQKDKGKQS